MKMTECEFREKLNECQRERDKLNDEVQVEIGFKLQAREELEKCQRDYAAMTLAAREFIAWTHTASVELYPMKLRRRFEHALAAYSGKDFVPLADVQPLVGALMNCLCALKSNDGPFVQPARDALATFRKAHP